MDDSAPPPDSESHAEETVRVRLRPYSRLLTLLLSLLTVLMLWALRWGENRLQQPAHEACHWQTLREEMLFLAQYEKEPEFARWMSGYFSEDSIYRLLAAGAVQAERDGYLSPAARQTMEMLASRYGDTLWQSSPGSGADGVSAETLPPPRQRLEIAAIMAASYLEFSDKEASDVYWASVRNFGFQLLLVVVLLPCGLAVVRLLRGPSGSTPPTSGPVIQTWRPGLMFGGWLRAEWMLAFSGVALSAMFYLSWLTWERRLPFNSPPGMYEISKLYLFLYNQFFSGWQRHLLNALFVAVPLLLMARWFAGGWKNMLRIFGIRPSGLAWLPVAKYAAGGLWIIVVFGLLTSHLTASMGWFDPRDGWRFYGQTFAEGLFYSCLLAPLCEETIFRGFLFKAFANRWRPWIAALLSSALFAIIHGYSLYGTAMVFLYGMLFAGLYHRTGSLWPGMICHAALNFLLLLANA